MKEKSSLTVRRARVRIIVNIEKIKALQEENKQLKTFILRKGADLYPERKSIARRNERICERFKHGATVFELSKKYKLSTTMVRMIVKGSTLLKRNF